MEHFLTFFIPLFVAIDPIGLVPVFLALTQAQDAVQRRRISVQAVAAATVIALGFLFLGRELFDFLQITADDFRIAGGAILLVLAVYDLISYGKPTAHETHMVGLVPLAMPLVAGPALLTTTLVLTSHTGPYNAYAMTTVAVIVNMGLLLMILFSANWISRVVGEHAMMALSKLVMVFLAAIAVNFIREGITNVLRTL